MNNLVLLASFAVYRNWTSILSWVRHDDLINTSKALGWLSAVCVLFLAVKRTTLGKSDFTKAPQIGPGALFFPSRTTHTRLFPQKHSFSYSYLLVGVPVGWRGRCGRMLAVDQAVTGSGNVKGSTQFSWFSVNAENYLERGQKHLGLDGKLRKFLAANGLQPGDYPYAYLFTQPQFLGYFNNPVSFWYIYGPDKKLKVMILEVNNTFEERRIYLLAPDTSKTIAEPLDKSTDSVTFTERWQKDFHVSPFSSRKGFYTLTTKDPLAPNMTSLGPLSATITLLSSKNQPKLVARLFSEGTPTDPAAMSLFDKTSFVCRWWWIVYFTFPRVAYEAAKLWFRKGLYVWGRPEPLTTTLSRKATASEAALERNFSKYLTYLVSRCAKPLKVIYIAAGVDQDEPEIIMSATASQCDAQSDVPTMRLKILTPVFYDRFIHYAHDLEAFFCESAESRTIELSHSELLPLLVLKVPLDTLQIDSWTDAFFFRAIQTLRRRPEVLKAVSYIGKPVDKQSARQDDVRVSKKDIRAFRPSSMDGFAMVEYNDAERASYRWEVLKVLVADRIAFGDTVILAFEWFMVKAALFWWVAGMLKP